MTIVREAQAQGARIDIDELLGFFRRWSISRVRVAAALHNCGPAPKPDKGRRAFRVPTIGSLRQTSPHSAPRGIVFSLLNATGPV